MTALAASRTKYQFEPGNLESYVLVDTVKAYQGGLAQLVIASGEVQPLSTVTGILHKFIGVFADEVDNADDGESVNVDTSGITWEGVASGLTVADVGKIAYGVDDQTFTLTAGTNTQVLGVVSEIISSTRAKIKLFPMESGGYARAYTVTNHTVDATFDADTAADAELADVLGTLILDLIARGIVSGSVSA